MVITTEIRFLDILHECGLITTPQRFMAGVSVATHTNDVKSVAVSRDQYDAMRAAVGPDRFDAVVSSTEN